MTARLRAQRVLREIGLAAGGEPVQRAPSLANEVWVLEDQVLRINPAPGSRRLRYEAALAGRLPEGVGYPPIIDVGESTAGEWLLLARVPGEPLSRVWPRLGERERRHAVHDLGARLKLVHSTDAPTDADHHDSPHVLEPARLADLLARSRRLPHVDPAVVDAALDLANRCAAHVDDPTAWKLVHGDLHFENVLWHEGAITAVLDFEFSRPGPPDLDLATLLRFCADPRLHVAEDYAAVTNARDYRPVPGWLWEAYPELFAAADLRQRLRFYLLVFDVWHLVHDPPTVPASELPQHHAYHRVQRAVEGRDELASFVL